MTDWKGNSRSAQYALAISKKDSIEQREANDFYATDPRALEALLDNCTTKTKVKLHECTKKPFYIWECACGTGNLSQVLNDRKYNVFSSDKIDRGYGMDSVDFLDVTKNQLGSNELPCIKVILTNPPFSLANEFIMHALDILPIGGIYIALMNLQVLAGIERYEKIYSNHWLREVYIFSKRIRCYKNNIPDNIAPIINYAWFVFEKGYNGSPTLFWL